MLIIKTLSKLIKEEIGDAEKYADLALKYKDEDRSLSDLFFELSNEELGHMNRLHNQVIRLISNYKNSTGSPPPAMQALYEYVHEEQIESVREVKTLLEMYKE